MIHLYNYVLLSSVSGKFKRPKLVVEISAHNINIAALYRHNK